MKDKKTTRQKEPALTKSCLFRRNARRFQKRIQNARCLQMLCLKHRAFSWQSSVFQSVPALHDYTSRSVLAPIIMNM